jgi:hypothetical protein
MKHPLIIISSALLIYGCYMYYQPEEMIRIDDLHQERVAEKIVDISSYSVSASLNSR